MIKRLILLLCVLAAGPAMASELDFELVNGTGRSFEAVYVTDSGNKDWDGNLLVNGAVLAPGGKLVVRFPMTAKSATWDVNVVDDEGLVVRFDKINLINVETVTLKDEAGKIRAVVE